MIHRRISEGVIDSQKAANKRVLNAPWNGSGVHFGLRGNDVTLPWTVEVEDHSTAKVAFSAPISLSISVSFHRRSADGLQEVTRVMPIEIVDPVYPSFGFGYKMDTVERATTAATTTTTTTRTTGK